jgi:hypothetical protein
VSKLIDGKDLATRIKETETSVEDAACLIRAAEEQM